jgi:hypothetical protein
MMQRPKVVPNLASHLGFDWSSVQTAINDASQAWYAYNNPHPVPVQPTPGPFLGGSIGNLVLIGGGLILAYALISKRR